MPEPEDDDTRSCTRRALVKADERNLLTAMCLSHSVTFRVSESNVSLGISKNSRTRTVFLSGHVSKHIFSTWWNT